MKYFIIFFSVLYSLAATPLHDAIEIGDMSALYSALKQGVHIDALKDGKTPLAWAVSHRQSQFVDTLLQAGAQIDAGHPTPLYLALQTGEIEIAKRLISQGAAINASGPLTNKGMVYDLLMERKYPAVLLLLNKGAKFVETGHLRAFSLALTYAPIEVVQAFIDRDVSLSDEDEFLGTPIDIALRYRRNDVLERIVDNGANVSAKNYLKTATLQGNSEAVRILVEGQSGLAHHDKTLVVEAVKKGNLEILKQLVEAGGDINYAVDNGQTALIAALKYGHKEMVAWLLEQKLDPQTNQEALFIAIDQGLQPIVAKLLEKNIGIDKRNGVGMTPLLWAFRHKKFEIAQFLIESGCAISPSDKEGETALFKAIRLHQTDLVRLLINKGADINQKNSLGQTPLYVAVNSANYGAFELLLASEAKLETFKLEESELYIAVKRGLERFFYKLKSKSELLFHATSEGDTLLHVASASNRSDIAKVLLFYGMNIEAKNLRGETPLHMASKQGHIEMASLLLSFDANISAQDAHTNTPRQLAYKYNQQPMVKWLDRFMQERQAQETKAQELLRAKEQNVTALPSTNLP